MEECTQLASWQAEGEAAYEQRDYSLARTFFANMLAKVIPSDPVGSLLISSCSLLRPSAPF